MRKKMVRYLLEFKLEVVRLMGARKSIAAVAVILWLADQKLVKS